MPVSLLAYASHSPTAAPNSSPYIRHWRRSKNLPRVIASRPLRCPSHCSLMRRTRRPLRQILLPTSATGGGRRICPGLTLRSKVQPPFYCKKQSPDQKVEGLFLVAEGGFEPPTSGLSLRAPCGARKNLRAIRPLDFFDRCANALLAVSAAGGARGRFPTSHAHRSHNPEL